MTHLPPGFALSFLLMYYAAGLLLWAVAFTFGTEDDFGYQRLAYYGPMTLALLFVLATVWPLLWGAIGLARVCRLARRSWLSVDVNNREYIRGAK
jgi:hypothetical protein